MTSDNGNEIPNQFIISDNGRTVFQSYSSVIAEKDQDGAVTLDADKFEYSKTTMKYLCRFLDVPSIADVRRLVANGTYKLSNLN